MSSISRRELLKTGAVSFCLSLLGDHVSAQDDPGQQVNDRVTSIKVSGMQANLCRDRVFLKLKTNHGIDGWGEIKGIVPQVAKTLVESMFELLEGQNPTRIEHLWQSLYRAERNQRGGAFMMHCIAGIDMALWDITGKLHGVPVYSLLGGPTRDRIRVYPSANSVKIGTGPKPVSGTPQDIASMVATVKNAREQVGREGAVMYDAHSAVPPATLIQFADQIEPYELLFLEEPAVPGNIEVFKRLKEQINIPLAAGERDRTIWGILPYLTENVLDIVQPDCGYTGGISQMKKIATLAEAYTVPLAPHCSQSYLGMTASFHVAASIPLFLIHESYDDDLWGQIVRPQWTKNKAGYVTLPEGSGLCVEIDERALARIAADPNYKYQWRGPHFRKDGSVTDY